jgi:hypothetical protein
MRVALTTLLLLASLALLPACAPIGQVVEEEVVIEERLRFERRIAPFEVLDMDGRPYEHPFFGGFNSPRPQLVDLTGGGRVDLVVQEVEGRMMLYENLGERRFEWRSDHWQGLDVGSWFRFGDLTGNGLPDLIANLSPGQVRYYRNSGTAAAPRFELVAEPLLDTAGRPIVAEDPNVPALIDIDGNGRLDLFLGQAERGYIRYYRNTGVDAGGIPRFEFVTNRWQNIEIYEANPTCDPFVEPALPPMPDVDGTASAPPLPGPEARLALDGSGGGRGTLHGENALTFADIDGDGAPDLFWGDFFTPSLYYFRNAGTPTEPLMSFVAPRFPLDDPLTSAGYNAPTFGDVDGDGTLDLVIGIVGGFCSSTANLIDNLYLLRNAGTPREPAFEEATGRLIHGVDVGRVSIPAFIDIDGDGALDLLVGSAYNSRFGGPRRASLFLYRNLGTNAAPRYQLVDDDFLTLDLDFANHYAPAFTDLSGDGRLDLVVGTFGGRLFWLRNQGQGAVAEFGEPVPLYTSGGRPINIGQTVVPTFADLTGNGLPDLIAGEFRGRLNLYQNVGSPGEPLFELVTNSFLDFSAGRFSAPSLVDITGNGLPDLLVGSEHEGLFIFANTGTPGEPLFEEIARLDPGRAQLAPAAADLTGDGAIDLILGTRAGGLLFLEQQP